MPRFGTSRVVRRAISALVMGPKPDLPKLCRMADARLKSATCTTGVTCEDRFHKTMV